MITTFFEEPSYYKSLYDKLQGTQFSTVLTSCPEFYRLTDPNTPKKKPKKDKKHIDKQPKLKSLLYLNKFINLKGYNSAHFRVKGTEITVYPTFQTEISDYNLLERAYYEHPYFINLVLDFIEEDEISYDFFKLDKVVEISSPYKVEPSDLTIPNLNLNKSLPLNCSVISNTSIITDIDIETSRRIAIPLHSSVASLNCNLWVIYGGIFKNKYRTDIIIIHKDDIGVLRVIKPEIQGLLPLPRSDAGICKYQDKLYVHGGKDATEILDDLFSIEIIQPKSDADKWKAVITHHICQNLPKRYNHELAHSEDKLYIIGGVDGRPGKSKAIYVLDPKTMLSKELHHYGVDFPYSYDYRFFTNLIVKGPLILVNPPVMHLEFRNKDSSNDNKVNYEAVMWILNTRIEHASTIRSIDDLNDYREYQHTHKIFNMPGNYFMNTYFDIFNRGIIQRLDFGPLYECSVVPLSTDSMINLLENLFETQAAADITIKTNNGDILCHSLILGLRKTETSRLISLIDENNTIHIYDDFPYEIIHSAVKYLYTDNLQVPPPTYFPCIIKTSSNCSKVYKDRYQYIQYFMLFAERYNMPALHQWLDLIIKFDCTNIGTNKLTLVNDLNDLYTIAEISGNLELQRSNSLMTQYNAEFSQPDLIIECSNGILSAHKLFMILRSSFCRGLILFRTDDRLDLSNYDEETVKLMVKYVYYDLQEFPTNKLIDLLLISKQLGIEGLSLIMQGKLSNMLNEHNLVEIADTAHIVNATHLLENIYSFVTKSRNKHLKACLAQLSSINPDFGKELIEKYSQTLHTIEFPVFLYDEIPELDEKIELYMINNPLPQLEDPCPRWLVTQYLNLEVQGFKEDLNIHKDTSSHFNINRSIYKDNTQITQQHIETSIVKRNRFELLDTEDQDLD